MTDYLIQSFCCLALFYLIYWAFFKNTRAYSINRFVLLAAVIFSLTVPILDLELVSPKVLGVLETEEVVEVLSYQKIEPIVLDVLPQEVDIHIDLRVVLYTGYLLVCGLLMIRFLRNLYVLFLKKRRSEQVHYQGTRLSLIDGEMGPFTFLRTVFLNKEDYHANRIEPELILHEMAHRKQWHSIDVLLIELANILFWFNPIIYLFKKQIKANHEYLADEFVLRAGTSPYAYSEKLLYHTFPDKMSGFSSGFNHLLIKQRLIMLSQFQQKKPSVFRYFSLIPVVFTLVLTTAFDASSIMDLRTPKEIQNDQELEIPGTIYASTLIWSKEENKLYLQGRNIQIRHGSNSANVNGRASYLGTVHYFVFNGKPVKAGQHIDVEGKKCSVVKLSKENGRKKYGNKGKMGVVEISVVE